MPCIAGRQAIDLSCGRRTQITSRIVSLQDSKSPSLRRLLPRISTSWRSELYFRNLEAEEAQAGKCPLRLPQLQERQLSTRPDEWMNASQQHSLMPAMRLVTCTVPEVTHSLDPQQVSKEALGLLKRPRSRCGHGGPGPWHWSCPRLASMPSE